MARCAICLLSGRWRLVFGLLVGFGFGLGEGREGGFRGEFWFDLFYLSLSLALYALHV
jgi:hypothetical protein